MSTGFGHTCRWTTKLSIVFLTGEKTQIFCNDAGAHRKQRKFLKKIKVLETNADAHKKKQESLSPEDRDLFDKNNTAAHYKYRKSLSPDQKGQIKSINAAAHKKQYYESGNNRHRSS